MRLLKILAAAVQLSLATCLPANGLTRNSWAPQSGKTYVNIGQNYFNEWRGYASAMKVPAGISVYGDIYSGCLNSDSQNLLSKYAASHSGFVEVGMSWKDAMTDNGYTQYQGAQLCLDIANGKYDETIRHLASSLQGFSNVRYLLRVDYEVSCNLFANTNPDEFDPSTFNLAAYPEAFAHVRRLMGGIMKNVEFVYHPVRGEAEVLYPGDSVVDWQGFSIFNNDVCLTVDGTPNCEGSQLDPNVLKDIHFAKKPKLVAESSVQPPSSHDASRFIEYLTRVKAMVETHDFAAWTYINSLWTAHGWDPSMWGDSRIEVRPEVLKWYKQNVASHSRYVFDRW